MIFPFMAIYFTDRLGASITGGLLVLNVILGIISGFYGGYLADKVGRKKVMAVGLFVNVLAYPIMALANSPWFDSVWLTFILFTINGVSSSLSGPATEAMLIDSSTRENRTYMYSLSYWSLNISAMIGSLLGGFFFKEHLFELLIGLEIACIITLFLVLFIMTDEYIPKKVVKKVNIIRDVINSYKVVIVDKTFVIFTFAIVFLWSLEEHGVNYIAVRIAEEFKPIDLNFLNLPSLHLDGIKVVGFISMENTFLVVTFTMFAVAWIRKVDPKTMLYIGILCYTLGYIFLGFTNSIVIIIIAGFVNTIGEIIYTPVLSSIKAELMNENARAAYSAFSSFSYHLTRLIGALGITLYSWIGSYGMSVVITLSGIVSFFLFRASFKLKKTQQKML
ncbi:MDR family MFS transporter [Psychrobacillus sp. L4]|uniref:MDR family MFS transporter n=1 Tax=Psychrobacillus sp. L4 TaxID=3236892 RepID=UPI0036F224EB